jgi:hypothetical protein
VIPTKSPGGWLGALILFVSPVIVQAQGLPFNTPTALPLALSENAVRSFYRHTEMGTLLRSGDEVSDATDRRLSVDLVPVVVPYGVRSKTTLFVGIPYLWKSFEMGGSEETNNGFGDVFVQVKQELLKRNFRGGTTRFAVFGRSSFPTGETKRDGDALPPPLRLGAGVVDLSGMAVFTHVDDRIGITGMSRYNVAAADHEDVRRGDRFQYGLALGYRLFPAVYESFQDKTWVGYLEFNGTVEAPATEEGTPLENTGGHTLFVSPGLQFIPTPSLLFEATIQVPVVRELRGEQLGPDWSLAVGGRILMTFLDR